MTVEWRKTWPRCWPRPGLNAAWVVHGEDGLDELSTTAPSRVFEWRPGNGGTRSFVVDPAELGLAKARPEDLKGGDPSSNARSVKEVLSGVTGPHRDIALLNAAAALVVVGEVAGLKEGLLSAAESVDSGRASACLEGLVKMSRMEADRKD